MPTYFIVPCGAGDTMEVSLQRTSSEPDSLCMQPGVDPSSGQVYHPTCAGIAMASSAPGCWNVPEGCQEIVWQVVLRRADESVASSATCVRAGPFVLIHEATALPRLQHAQAGAVVLACPATRDGPSTTLQSFTLSGPNDMPLAMVCHAVPAGALSRDPVTLAYWLDQAENAAHLPSLTAHGQGATWLATVFLPEQRVALTTLWMSAAAGSADLGGLATRHMLIANYLSNGASPFGQAMLLYIALHEAVHAMAPPAGKAWLSESVAAYYGLRATQVALHNDPAVAALEGRFCADAEAFAQGLPALDRAVANGDGRARGGFYTKGLLFWREVDRLLRLHGETGLDAHIVAVLHSQRVDVDVDALAHELALPPAVWRALRQRFLD